MFCPVKSADCSALCSVVGLLYHDTGAVSLDKERTCHNFIRLKRKLFPSGSHIQHRHIKKRSLQKNHNDRSFYLSYFLFITSDSPQGKKNLTTNACIVCDGTCG